MTETTTVLCVLYRGDEYDASWVDRLYRGFARHSRTPFRFVCLNDGGHEFAEAAVESVPLLAPTEGWMTLLEMFRPDLGVTHGVAVGLDTVVVGDVTHLIEWRGGMVVTRSPYRPTTLCNAVVLFDRQEADRLWQAWWQRRPHWRAVCAAGLRADQAGRPSEVIYLRHQSRRQWQLVDDLWPGDVLSYKAHWLPQPEARQDARIVYFHGDPRPSAVADPVIVESWQ